MLLMWPHLLSLHLTKQVQNGLDLKSSVILSVFALKCVEFRSLIKPGLTGTCKDLKILIMYQMPFILISKLYVYWNRGRCYIIVLFWCIEKSNPLSGNELFDCEIKLCIIGTLWNLRHFKTAPLTGQKFKKNYSCLYVNCL